MVKSSAESNPRLTTLAKPSSSRKLHTRHSVRKDAPHQQTNNLKLVVCILLRVLGQVLSDSNGNLIMGLR
jgi:hypothetical protein